MSDRPGIEYDAAMDANFDPSKMVEAKPCLSLCPGALVRAVARVFDQGRQKPGREAGGWLDRITTRQEAEAALDMFTDALYRHQLELTPGAVPEIGLVDESGEFVVAHIAANCGMMLGVFEKFPELATDYRYGRRTPAVHFDTRGGV